MSVAPSLPGYVDTLNLLGDESRIRLCALLRERELCVTDLVRVTGIAQSRVSTHLGRLREAGFVRDRRQGAQSFYALVADSLPRPCAPAWTRRGLGRPDARRRSGAAARARRRAARRRARAPRRARARLLARAHLAVAGRRHRRAAAARRRARRRLGRRRRGQPLAPYCRSLTCIDTNARHDRGRAASGWPATPHVRAQVADVHELPFATASFDAVLVFHTLTYAEHPARALAECARVLRPGGRLVLLCLDQHEQHEVTARYGERHPGFSPRALRGLLAARRPRRRRPPRWPAARPRSRTLQVVLAIADKPPARRDEAALTDDATIDHHPLEKLLQQPHRHHRRRDGHDHPHLRHDRGGHPRRAVQGLEEGSAEQRRPLLADAARR